MGDNGTIRQFRADDSRAFAELNREWIEHYFTLEESDRRQLEQPQEVIIENGGGFIAIGEAAGTVVAAGGLLAPHHMPNDGRKWLEIVKMATAKHVRGTGMGGRILDRLISEARARSADGIWLETNDRLVAAVSLYESRGFVKLGREDLWPTPYSRCNLQMVKTL